MADAQPISADTVVRMGAELAGTPVFDDDLQAVVALLNGLVSEMGPLRAMEIGDMEPATSYDPSLP